MLDKRDLSRLAALAALLSMWGVACSRPRAAQPTAATVASIPATPESAASSLWIAPSVPETLRQLAAAPGLAVTGDRASAGLQLTISKVGEPGQSDWLFALVAPFPTVLDGVAAVELRDFWDGTSTDSFSGWSLWMSPSTLAAFSELWGKPAGSIKVGTDAELLDSAWAQRPSWAIVPFEALEPRWKVLTVDGQSPIRQDFDPDSYALRIPFSVKGAGAAGLTLELPPTNRDSRRMTSLVLTGTSGLAREIAYQMEVKGITYPARDIGDWLRDADIAHVSHEVSFDPSCPPPNPLKPRFYCGNPAYLGLFDSVGVDVVELTGNHILDNGIDSFLFTLGLYKQHGMSYYGGGANLEEAERPLLIEDHGNRIALLGCNFAEPPQPLAGSRRPGANPCDWTRLAGQISELRSQGFLPVVTLQYKEGYSPVVMPWQTVDFHRPAEAGAAIVSGSQSHVPLQMEFYSGAFIHHGLGNLFFGQMANQPPGPNLPLQPAVRYEFLDRHVFYDGRYISTELLTAMLEDYSRPRPMNPEERRAVLEAYFGYSAWIPLVPTIVPEQTPTLYPLLKFIPVPTYTPAP